MKTVGLIRVVSGLPRELEEAHADLLQSEYPSLRVVTAAIDGFPRGLYDPELAERAVPAILHVAESLAPRVDALAVSCADDPGVAELRQLYPKPVLGAGASLAAACLALGGKVGVLTMTTHLPCALGMRLEGRDFAWRHVPGVRDTTDLVAAREAILATASQLIDAGCTVLALACTGFSTTGTAAVLRERLSRTVLDPVLTMGAMLSACVQ